MVLGLLVTGTDTGVGKTVVSAACAGALRVGGRRVAAYKPVVSGLDGLDPHWPADHELLAAITGQGSAEVAPVCFGPPLSPHLAAAQAGVELEPTALVAGAHRAAAGAQVLIVEGVGGLRVPLTGDYDVRDLAVDLGLPVVVVARPGLGTINHTLLTVESARGAGLDVRAVILTPWPGDPGPLELSNRETIAARGSVEVATLPRVDGPDPRGLAVAGLALPVERWLGPLRAAPARGHVRF